ncbi:hypothetical protein FKM82_016674 [Ascaphus truei]
MAQLVGIIRRSFRRKLSTTENLKEGVPPKDVGAPEDRRMSVLSGGQCFFEYLVVVSLKKNPAGDYAPQITYQFPKPAGRGSRLPEVYCIISYLGCFGLFAKILEEVEKRRQISTAVIYPFMQGLREAAFPAPGKTVKIKSFIPGSGTEIIELTRPLDSRLEHVNFKTLMQCISSEKILQIFASVVLERRVVFFAKDLSILSQCIHAVVALLYPFTWEHTYIPVLPQVLLDTVCCPTPFMVGIQTQFLDQVLEQPMEEVLIVDLCEGKLIRIVGDETKLLPHKLQAQMLTSLNDQQMIAQTSEEVNMAVSDTFTQFFVSAVGHYSSHFKANKCGARQFQEKSFLKAVHSKSLRKFLKHFVQTQMFSLFIQGSENSTATQEGYFQQKVQEFHMQNKPNRK